MKVSELIRLLGRVAAGESTGGENAPCRRSLLFEALEPRLLLSADGLLPDPTPETFSDTLTEPGAVVDQAIAAPGLLDEPIPDVGRMDPDGDPGIGAQSATAPQGASTDFVQSPDDPA
ncbi:MAG: LEPR-XLL domain-containing protein, partial [Proteobacteria bacterium]